MLATAKREPSSAPGELDETLRLPPVTLVALNSAKLPPSSPALLMVSQVSPVDDVVYAPVGVIAVVAAIRTNRVRVPMAMRREGRTIGCLHRWK